MSTHTSSPCSIPRLMKAPSTSARGKAPRSEARSRRASSASRRRSSSGNRGEGVARGDGDEVTPVAARADQVALRLHDRMADLAGCPRHAPEEPSPENDPGPDLSAYGHEDLILVSPARPVAVLAVGLGVRVVVDIDRRRELALEGGTQRKPLEAMKVRHGDEHPFAVARWPAVPTPIPRSCPSS